MRLTAVEPRQQPTGAAPGLVRTRKEEKKVSDWRDRAACRDEDPELFFPIGTDGPALAQAERAKSVCRQCRVIEQCLAWALAAGEDAGIWGGLTAEERRALRRRRPASDACGGSTVPAQVD